MTKNLTCFEDMRELGDLGDHGTMLKFYESAVSFAYWGLNLNIILCKCHLNNDISMLFRGFFKKYIYMLIF
jgi:hypothetical protein